MQLLLTHPLSHVSEGTLLANAEVSILAVAASVETMTVHVNIVLLLVLRACLLVEA